MTKLRVAPDLALPLDTATSTLSLLAMKGSGKTHTASVIAEEMLKAKIPIVAIDPVGVWWGLRSSADGKRPGFPVVVMGGEHADLPLDVGAGELVARFIVDERPAGVVLDLSLMRKAEAIRFMVPFVETLYHKNREVLHVFWDECDLHIPQKPFADQARLLGAAEDLVRRGRARGLGVSLISQRPAVVNKDVLTQTSTLVVLRMTGPQDVAAVKGWVEQHDIEDIAPEMLASLPSLPKGDSWWWSPGELEIFKHTRARQRETFDSSRTPKVGERVKPPKVLAPVDLERLRTTMAETIEKAKADDPKLLKAEVHRLRGELQRASKQAGDRVSDKGTVEAARQLGYEKGYARAVSDINSAFRTHLKKAKGLAQRIPEVKIAAVNDAIVDLVKSIDEAIALTTNAPTITPEPPEVLRAPRAENRTERGVPRGKSVERERPIARNNDGTIPPAQQRILDALAALHAAGVAAPPKENVAVFAGASPTSSSFANNLGALRSSGMIDYPSGGVVALTGEGRAIADPGATIGSLDELHAAWQSKLPPAQWKIVAQLIDAYPERLERAQLAEEAGASPTSSSYANNLGALRSLGLIDYASDGDRRVVYAKDLLFPEGLS